MPSLAKINISVSKSSFLNNLETISDTTKTTKTILPFKGIQQLLPRRHQDNSQIKPIDTNLINWYRNRLHDITF